MDVDAEIRKTQEERQKMEDLAALTFHTDLYKADKYEGYERSIPVNDEEDNLDATENEIARKMASFTAPKQFFRDPPRAEDEDEAFGFKGKIIDREDDATHSQSASNGDCNMEDCTRITKLHVNPIVLAEKNPYFHDLFTNATMESEEQRRVTLSIHASEGTAAMELLNYMHSGTLTATTEPALLDVLKLADKFRVAPCVRLCSSLLSKMPMTLEFALVYLSLQLVSDEEQVRHLVDAAKQFVVTRFAQVEDNGCEITKMPLAGMEAILSSDSIEPFWEDTVFDLALQWTKANYPNPEDRRRIFSTRLARYIRFPYMSPWMLKEEVLSCDLLDGDFARKAAVDALYSKIETPFHHHQHRRNPTDVRPRKYCHRLIKVVEFEFPCPEIVVYHDLCISDDDRTVQTDYFKLGPLLFSLFVSARGEDGRFVISLEKEEDDDSIVPVPHDLEYEFAVRSKCTKRFVVMSGGPITIVGQSVIYEAPLIDFKAGKSLDFIDGVVYIELKLRKNENHANEIK